MTINLSKEVLEKMFGDEAVLNYLQICENEFKAGNRMALFEALQLCAQFQAVIPDWAADAILEGGTEISSGKQKDFNELFGYAMPNQRTRKREARIEYNTSKVLGMLMKHRCDGGSMNVDEAFGEISVSTGIPRRDIEEIYRRSGQWVKDISQGNPEGSVRGFLNGKVPMPRRHGRPIL